MLCFVMSLQRDYLLELEWQNLSIDYLPLVVISVIMSVHTITALRSTINKTRRSRKNAYQYEVCVRHFKSKNYQEGSIEQIILTK